MNPDAIARKKARLQCQGVRIPQELIPELETQYNAPSVRTDRLVFCLESPDEKGDLIPVFIVNGKRVSKSPLHMVKHDSGFEIWDTDKKYTDIMLTPRPKFYDN